MARSGHGTRERQRHRGQMFTHLRRNAVAYFALAVACSTGTAYAAGQPGSSAPVGHAAPAPAPQPGVTWVGGKSIGLVGNPTAAPDKPLYGNYAFTLPRDGVLAVSMYSDRPWAECSTKPAKIGLYLDSTPIAGTRKDLWDQANRNDVALTGLINVTAGPHTVGYAIDCPNGNLIEYAFLPEHWWLVLGE
jgi:hypothetical protein